MASDSDDADADFFDKLVDDGDPPPSAPAPADLVLGKANAPAPDPDPDQPAAAAPDAEPSALAPALSEVKAPPPPEMKSSAPPTPQGGTPGSAKAVHTAVKQVQWSVFAGATADQDPFGDFSASTGDDAFFGGAASASASTGDLGSSPLSTTSTATSVAAAQHSVSDSNGLDANADARFDWGASAVEPVDRNASATSKWTSGAVDSSDPNYLESLYPGWKYDEATQQWYQVDTSGGVQGNVNSSSAVLVTGSDNVQQQQHFSVPYMQNSSHAALETIAEEGNTTAASWGQSESSAVVAEYPPNMVFYAEYPGWYFDTSTQQWQTLESYQQGLTQAATATSASVGFAWAGHNVVDANNSYGGTYNRQNQWQQGSSGYSMQPEILRDDSSVNSSYGFHQHSGNQASQQANAGPLDSTTNYWSGINTMVPPTSQQTGIDGHRDSFKGFQPANYQSTYKSAEPSVSQQSTSSHHSGYKGFEPSKHNLAGHQGFKPITNNQSYNASIPSRVGQIGHKEFGPSIDSHVSHVAHEPSTNHGYGSSNGVAEPKDFVPMANMYQTQTNADPTPHMHLTNSYLGSGNSMNFAQQQLIGSNASSQQFGYSSDESAGRPPHALVTFGFGGKLIVVKETSSMTTNFSNGNEGNSSGTVSILNISEIVADKIDEPSIPNSSALSYFHALCRQPIPGPLVGGSAAAKDVNKWLDEIIRSYESYIREFQGGDVQKLLISLLKILCQHYGKLRSPFGSDVSQEGTDGPEMAVTKLFSSCNGSNAYMNEYGAIVHCMKNIPSENQIQATAHEVQNLLVSGRRKEALQRAQEGQLWGPALILGLQLGDQFYADTVKKMAHHHFVSGSPLRTLCLLIAGQPADVFNVESPVDGYSGHRPQQPAEGTSKSMLDNWQENLSILTANRTKGDDLVITHLGDCLWKEKNEVAAAHSCYLVAELNIDSYSESARICLVGADHWKCPRTFISPEAIQRTELYEYAKVLGNSQYILLPFQPYKLIYAHMLAEVGKVSESLRYCQASLKLLKASGRAPELEACKQLFSSLEERIRTHQQGGYGTNLAPAKIVGKIFTSIDKSLSRMMGTQSPPLPPPQGSSNGRDIYSVPLATRVVASQSEMAMSSLMSSTSEQSMSEMAGNSGPGRKAAHNRSVSEPDFGRSPKQAAGSDNAQSTSGSGSSRFGWLLQKTMGLVSKSHHQAKLGEQNKFYYDEKLKRWVEEGAEIPAEEPPLPPPPRTTSFQNSIPDYNQNGPSTGGFTANGFAEAKPSNPSEHSSGMPPIAPSQNQFSARGRMGVRSRYVDTFNKGGANSFGATTATSFSKPAPPSMNPLAGATFFVPTPSAVASGQMPDSTAYAHSENTHQNGPSRSPEMEVSSASPPPLPMQSSMHHRFSSMDNIMTPRSDMVSSSLSRSRAASWSGTYTGQLSTSAASRSPDGQAMQPAVIPGWKPSHSRSNSNSSALLNGFGEDLHEVEL